MRHNCATIANGVTHPIAAWSATCAFHEMIAPTRQRIHPCQYILQLHGHCRQFRFSSRRAVKSHPAVDHLECAIERPGPARGHPQRDPRRTGTWRGFRGAHNAIPASSSHLWPSCWPTRHASMSLSQMLGRKATAQAGTTPSVVRARIALVQGCRSFIKIDLAPCASQAPRSVPHASRSARRVSNPLLRQYCSSRHTVAYP
jgi:hypothetical protein